MTPPTPTVSQADRDAALHTLMTKALAWAFWCIGEGYAGDGSVDPPDDFFWDYSVATDDNDWETYADRLPARHRTEATAELLEALKPFAQALIDDPDADEHEPDNRDIWEHSIAMTLTFGDLRRARTAIAKHESR